MKVRAPTLLLVGGLDTEALELNQATAWFGQHLQS